MKPSSHYVQEVKWPVQKNIQHLSIRVESTKKIILIPLFILEGYLPIFCISLLWIL